MTQLRWLFTSRKPRHNLAELSDGEQDRAIPVSSEAPAGEE
jgi:hypothetical protein